jgi:hypothetical protein
VLHRLHTQLSAYYCATENSIKVEALEGNNGVFNANMSNLI